MSIEAPVVIATGECGRCGSDCRAPVENKNSIAEVDIRCGDCGRVTVLREFEPPSGGML